MIPQEEDVLTAKHVPLGLTEKDLVEMYTKMVLARVLDDRLWALNRQGKIPFFTSCRGHEAAQVGSAYVLRRGQDFVLPYYRDWAVVLVLGMSTRELMAGAFAKATDPCTGGRQMPAHFGYPPLRIISGSSPVATQIPHAVGVALGCKLRGEEAVTIVYFGDGATSKGDFHEGVNFAAIHQLPVIFFCENNSYAISVPLKKQMAIGSIADRAKGYGFPGISVDGNDPLAVYQATKEAHERVRRGEGPMLIEARTYRLVPHSTDDDDRRYRSREEVEAWKKRDPIDRFKGYLEKEGILTGALDREIWEETTKEVDDATEFAEKSPYPDPEDVMRHIYFEG